MSRPERYEPKLKARMGSVQPAISQLRSSSRSTGQHTQAKKTACAVSAYFTLRETLNPMQLPTFGEFRAHFSKATMTARMVSCNSPHGLNMLHLCKCLAKAEVETWKDFSA